MAFRQLVPWKSRAAAVAGVTTLVIQLMSRIRRGGGQVPENQNSDQTRDRHSGENRTFDHVFATYEPKRGETIDNLLSKGIVNEDAHTRTEFFQGQPIFRDRHQR